VARTTADKVKGLLLRDYDSVDVPALTGFIDTASSLVDDVAAYGVANDEAIPAARLELIERWLSAHCYQANDPSYTSRSNSGGSGSFMWAGEQSGFKATRYGDMAVSLDPTGVLLAAGKEKVGFFWGGKAEPDQLTYDQRN
jgi:hypothetical protein